jgi:DNA primase
MIDQGTIQKIYDVANIKDVVEDYVSLQRRGINYLGLCPFHDDKRPSFYVSPTKNICHCFVCGGGGNPVNFLMKVENITYIEAIKLLAKKYHIEVEEKEMTPEQKMAANERESLMTVNEWLNLHFIHNLTETAEGQNIGLSYFMQKRKFREDIIKKFQLGYAIDKRDEYTLEAQSKGYKLEYLLTLGATIHNEEHNSNYDRYYGRAIFPIHSISGKVVAFGGRRLKEDESAKYQNSPESIVYQKRDNLYGIYFAKKSIQKEKKCYIVEGYCDVVSMVQAGIENIVAPCGTALTEDQIRLLKRIIPSVGSDNDEEKNVTMMYDGDAAGIHAALKNGRLLLEQGLNVHVVVLPPEDDPDTFAQKHNGSEVKDYLEKNEQDYVIFFAKHFLPEIQSDPIKRSSAIAETAATIAVIPDRIKRSVYIQECCHILNANENDIYQKILEIKEKMVEEERKKVLRTGYAPAQNWHSSLQVSPITNPASPATAPSGPTATATAQQAATATVPIASPDNTDSQQNSATPFQSHTAEVHTSQPSALPQPSHQQTLDDHGAILAPPPAVTSPFDKLERNLLLYLIRFGRQIMFQVIEENGEKKKVAVGEYIQEELQKDDIDFQNPLFKQMKDEAILLLKDPQADVEQHFLTSTDPFVSKTALELVTDRYFPDQDNNLNQTVPHYVLDLKLQVVKMAIKKIYEDMRTADATQKEQLLLQLIKMNEVRSVISRDLGTVTN